MASTRSCGRWAAAYACSLGIQSARQRSMHLRPVALPGTRQPDLDAGTSTQSVTSQGTATRSSVDDTPSTITGTPTGTVSQSAPTLLAKSQR